VSMRQLGLYSTKQTESSANPRGSSRLARPLNGHAARWLEFAIDDVALDPTEVGGTVVALGE
jgi:hypothetical protein